MIPRCDYCGGVLLQEPEPDATELVWCCLLCGREQPTAARLAATHARWAQVHAEWDARRRPGKPRARVEV